MIVSHNPTVSLCVHFWELFPFKYESLTDLYSLWYFFSQYITFIVVYDTYVFIIYYVDQYSYQ